MVQDNLSIRSMRYAARTAGKLLFSGFNRLLSRSKSIQHHPEFSRISSGYDAAGYVRAANHPHSAAQAFYSHKDCVRL
jgi:hypothetical protein